VITPRRRPHDRLRILEIGQSAFHDIPILRARCDDVSGANVAMNVPGPENPAKGWKLVGIRAVMRQLILDVPTAASCKTLNIDFMSLSLDRSLPTS